MRALKHDLRLVSRLPFDLLLKRHVEKRALAMERKNTETVCALLRSWKT